MCRDPQTNAGHSTEPRGYDRAAGAPVVLGLAASPRRRGNSETLLDAFLEGAEDNGASSQKLVVSALRVAPCLGCHRCRDTGKCIQKDAYQTARDAVMRADVVALATPAYFWNLPAQMKAFVDRHQSLWAHRAVSAGRLPSARSGRGEQRGVLLAVAGDPDPRFQGLRQTVDSFFSVYYMKVWEAALFSGLLDIDDVRNHPEMLATAHSLGGRSVLGL